MGRKKGAHRISQKEGARSRHIRRLDKAIVRHTDEGLPLFRNVFFEPDMERRFANIRDKIGKQGFDSLTDEQKKLYEDVTSAIRSNERWEHGDTEITGHRLNCPKVAYSKNHRSKRTDSLSAEDLLRAEEREREEYDMISCTCDGEKIRMKDLHGGPEPPGPSELKGLFHPGIKATPFGIVIPPGISLKDLCNYYSGQYNELRKKYFAEAKPLKSGHQEGSGYRMPPGLRSQIWKEFVRLVAGDDAARKSAVMDLESLKNFPKSKRMNWGNADKILSKKFKLPLWKIRLATRR